MASGRWIYGPAYRRGFPCRTTAEYVGPEGVDGRAEGFHLGECSQHCAAFIIMQIKFNRGLPWPGIGDDPEVAHRLAALVDMAAPVVDHPENSCRPTTAMGGDIESDCGGMTVRCI